MNQYSEKNKIKSIILNPWAPHLLSLMFFLFFWFFRSVRMDEGSGDLWYREIEGGIWFRKRRMLSFFLYQLTYQIFNPLFHWDARWVMNFISCLAGAIFVFFLYKICQRWEKGWIPFVLVMSSGMSTLFYGFLETYSMVIAATAIFFYYLFEYLENKSSPIYPGLTYSLAACFHVQVGFLFPVIPLAWYHHGKNWKDWKPWFIGLLPCFILVIAIRYFSIGEGDFFENIHWVTFKPQQDSTEPYTIFSLIHLKEFAWFQYRIAAITLPCLILLPFFLKKEIKKNPVVQILSLATAGFLFLNFFHYTLRDLSVWTVFAIYGFPSTLLVGYLLTHIRLGKEIAVILTVVSLYITVPFILDHTRIGNRGEGTLYIEEMPANALILLDGYQKKNPVYKVLEGDHFLRIIYPPDKFEQKITISPYSTLTIRFDLQSGHFE